MKAIWIRSDKQTVEEVEYGGLDDLKRMVGGYIELGFHWPNGDVLYVDEEGSVRPDATGFIFRLPERPDQWLFGNSVIVGREVGMTANTDPPTHTAAQVSAKVMWGRAGVG